MIGRITHLLVPPQAVPDAATRADLDAAIASLRARRAAWVAVPPGACTRLLGELRHDVAAVADEWTAAVAEAERLSPTEASEEALAGPYMLRLAAMLPRAVVG
jgi:acyl-CoA reductase-like NAD-dependent aldehyde dehydrogenase